MRNTNNRSIIGIIQITLLVVGWGYNIYAAIFMLYVNDLELLAQNSRYSLILVVITILVMRRVREE